MTEFVVFLLLLVGILSTIIFFFRKKTGQHKVDVVISQINEVGLYDITKVYELQYEYSIFGITYWAFEDCFYSEEELNKYLRND